MPRSRSSSPEAVAIDSGTLLIFSARFCAVTTISCSSPSGDSFVGGACASAAALTKNAEIQATGVLIVRIEFVTPYSPSQRFSPGHDRLYDGDIIKCQLFSKILLNWIIMRKYDFSCPARYT